MIHHHALHHGSLVGALDLFTAGAGFDIAGAWLLASSIMLGPRDAAWRMIQGQNSFARFDVRTAEDHADGQIGRFALAFGFLFQAIGYVLSAHGVAPLAHTPTAYVLLAGSAIAAIVIVWAIELWAGPRLRDRWLVQYARFDNRGWKHTLPSGAELLRFGEITERPPFHAEYGDNAAYAKRVFHTETRDPSKDHEVRPANFQPFVPIDDAHGYTSEQPRRRRRFRRGRHDG